MTSLLIPASGNRGPAPNLGEPLLEVITQPLYSAMEFDSTTLPVTRRCFNYAIGSQVAGTGEAGATPEAATLYHTNMEVASALATPKVFEVFGLRMVVSNLNAAGTTAPTSPAAPSDSILTEDVLRLFNATHLTFHVGTKDYVSGPSWLFPGNCGVSGFASLGSFDTTTVEQEQIEAVQGQGRYMNLAPYTVFIPSQQTFYVDLDSPQTARPILDVSRLVWVMLDGRLGREAQ